MSPMERRRFLQLGVVGAGLTLLDRTARAEYRAGGIRPLPLVSGVSGSPRTLGRALRPERGRGNDSGVCAGLAARKLLRSQSDVLIYEDIPHDGYQRWFAAYCQAHRPQTVWLNLDEVVVRLLACLSGAWLRALSFRSVEATAPFGRCPRRKRKCGGLPVGHEGRLGGVGATRGAGREARSPATSGRASAHGGLVPHPA